MDMLFLFDIQSRSTSLGHDRNYTAFVEGLGNPQEINLGIEVKGNRAPRPCSGDQLVPQRLINFFAGGGPIVMSFFDFGWDSYRPTGGRLWSQEKTSPHMESPLWIFGVRGVLLAAQFSRSSTAGLPILAA